MGIQSKSCRGSRGCCGERETGVTAARGELFRGRSRFQESCPLPPCWGPGAGREELGRLQTHLGSCGQPLAEGAPWTRSLISKKRAGRSFKVQQGRWRFNKKLQAGRRALERSSSRNLGGAVGAGWVLLCKRENAEALAQEGPASSTSRCLTPPPPHPAASLFPKAKPSPPAAQPEARCGISLGARPRATRDGGRSSPSATYRLSRLRSPGLRDAVPGEGLGGEKALPGGTAPLEAQGAGAGAPGAASTSPELGSPARVFPSQRGCARKTRGLFKGILNKASRREP